MKKEKTYVEPECRVVPTDMHLCICKSGDGVQLPGSDWEDEFELS